MVKIVKKKNGKKSFKKKPFEPKAVGLNANESKFLDTAIPSTTITSAGAILNSSMCIVPQGTQQQQRAGKKILVTSVAFRGVLDLPSQINQSLCTNNVRLVLYLDKQTNGNTATVAELLQEVNESSFRNMNQVNRFEFIYDKIHTLNQHGVIFNTTAITNRVQKYIKFFKKCRIPIIYDQTATTGALTTIRSNNIGLMAISTSDSLLLNFEGICRIRFSDN